MSRIVYADHAATTALSDTALKAMLPYFNQSYGNPSSLYSFAQQAKPTWRRPGPRWPACLNAQPEEIYFTSCGSESDNWALRGVAEQKKDKGRHIITSAIEHHAILHTARYLEKQGFEVTYLPVDGQGRVDPAAVKAALRPGYDPHLHYDRQQRDRHHRANRGDRGDRREAGVLFHTDAVQAVGHIPVDVQAWKVDLLSLSGHKFRGPRGMGALYVRKGVRLPPLMFGGGQEKGRRAGTENVAGAVGLAAALREATDGLAAESARLSALRISSPPDWGVSPIPA